MVERFDTLVTLGDGILYYIILYYIMDKRKIEKYKRIFIVLIFVLSINSVFGQFDFRKGYVVTQENDTISGYVEYGNASTNTYSCFFKIDSLATPIKYSPQDLKEISIDDYRHYISKEVQINGISQILFLEYLLDGSLDLYFVIDKRNVKYYFIEKEGVMYELSNEKKIVNIDGKTYRVNSNKYIGILKFLLKESPTAYSKIENTGFNHKSFIQIAKDYHQDVCDSEDCIIYTRDQKRLNDVKWRFNVGISVNYNFSKTEITSDINYSGITVANDPGKYYVPKLTSSNVGDKIGENRFVSNYNYIYPGLYFNISPGHRTSFQVEFWYKENQLSNNQYTIKSKSISIPFIIKREFLYHKKLSPFIDLGLSYNYHFNPKLNELSLEYTYPVPNDIAINMYSESISLKNYEYQLTSNSRFGLMFGCGLSYDINKKHALLVEMRKVFNSFKSKKESIAKYLSLSSDFSEKSTVINIGYYYSF